MHSILTRLEPCSPDLRAYLLIDNSAYDGDWITDRPATAVTRFAPVVHQLKGSDLPHVALWGSLDDPHASAVVPLLVEWRHSLLGPSVLRILETASPGKCALSILHCAEPLDIVAERLRLRLRMPLMDGDYLLRFFDTRILHELMPCLSPAQAASFSSLAAAWHYRNRDDHWETLPASDDRHDEGLPLQFDSAQCEAFLRIGSADRLEAAIGELLRDNPLNGKTPGERYRWIRARQHEAERQGLVEHTAQLPFCLQALSEGAPVDPDGGAFAAT